MSKQGEGEGDELKVPRETSGDPATSWLGVSVLQGTEEILSEWEEVACLRCTQVFARKRGLPDSGRCAECDEQARIAAALDHEVRSLMGDFDRHMTDWLRRAGMSPRELSATQAKIPGPLATLLFRGDGMPAISVRSMMNGKRPTNGFGLSGGAGLGKTFALASIMKRMVGARWSEWVPARGRKALHPWMAWISWPEAVNKLRVISMEEDGLAQAERKMERLAAVEVLMLDDVGVERLRGAYEEDWAASQLDQLIDTRYNELRPTWYTTNLTAQEITERYGSRLFSRLCGENPLFTAPKGPDLRIMGRVFIP